MRQAWFFFIIMRVYDYSEINFLFIFINWNPPPPPRYFIEETSGLAKNFCAQGTVVGSPKLISWLLYFERCNHSLHK